MAFDKELEAAKAALTSRMGDPVTLSVDELLGFALEVGIKVVHDEVSNREHQGPDELANCLIEGRIRAFESTLRWLGGQEADSAAAMDWRAWVRAIRNK
jgi:hypothetical protein